MPRTFGTIYTTIWSDPAFLALPARQQRTYLFLVTQPDISPTGVLPLTMRRWAAKVPDQTADDIAADLDGLAAARFVVLDYDTEEVLVRSFFRRDLVWKQPNIMGKFPDLVAQIDSPGLREALAAELRKLEPEALPDTTPKGGGPSARQAVEQVLMTVLGSLPARFRPPEQGALIPFPDPHGDGVSDPHPNGIRDGVPEGVPEGGGNPVPRTRAGARAPAQTQTQTQTPTTSLTAEPLGFAEFWSAYPRRVDKADARKAWPKALAKVRGDWERIVAGAEVYALAREGEPGRYTKHPSTWLNHECWDDDVELPQARPRPRGEAFR